MSSRPNVIFVVLDTVRADRVSGLGYDQPTTPQFDDFLAEATTFTDAVAQAPWSVPSHASLFTGEYPSEHEATVPKPVLSEGPVLAERLGAAGYETYGVSPNEYVRPATGFARGFEEFHTLGPLTEPPLVADLLGPAVNWFTSTARVRYPAEQAFNLFRSTGATTTEPPAPPEYGAVETAADIIDRVEDPFFLFVNLFDAHLPRSPAPEHRERFVDENLADAPVVANERAYMAGEYDPDERALRRMSQLYDADLRTLDDRFGALIERLQAAGVYEDSLVVAVSDHGEHLGEFGLLGHQFSVFDDVVSVPLGIKYPDGGPDRIDEQVEIQRLYHTILDEAGVAEFPTRSLASGEADEVARGAYHPPMVDVERYLWEGEFEYAPELLGEALTFARTGEEKRLCFDGAEWLFDLPESECTHLPRGRAGEDAPTQAIDAPEVVLDTTAED
jgi:arylsulfatase A-like enzyme